MSIFEYNEELALSYIREDEYQKGHEDGWIEGEKLGRIEGEKLGRIEGEKLGRIQGEAVGIEKGEAIKLIELVCKKMKKGKPAEIIAEELEEKPSVVKGIYRIAEEYGTDDCDKIYERLKIQEK